MKTEPNHHTSAGALVGLAGGIILLAYLFRRTLEELFLAAGLGRLTWLWLRHQLGVPPIRERRSVWKVAAAGLGGFILGGHRKREEEL